MLTGTEAEIINSVARLRRASKIEIRRAVGFSLEYIDYVCRYLIRRGYLIFEKGFYYLTKDKIETLLAGENAPKIDRKLLKEVGYELAKEITGELKKTVRQVKSPDVQARGKIKHTPKRQIEIKTDFEFPIEDESLVLESNIDKIGATLEKEKSDIESKVELLKGIQRRGKK